MRAIAHGGCTDTVRECVCTVSWLWEKNPLAHRGFEPCVSIEPRPFSRTLPAELSLLFTYSISCFLLQVSPWWLENSSAQVWSHPWATAPLVTLMTTLTVLCPCTTTVAEMPGLSASILLVCRCMHIPWSTISHFCLYWDNCFFLQIWTISSFATRHGKLLTDRVSSLDCCLQD